MPASNHLIFRKPELQRKQASMRFRGWRRALIYAAFLEIKFPLNDFWCLSKSGRIAKKSREKYFALNLQTEFTHKNLFGAGIMTEIIFIDSLRYLRAGPSSSLSLSLCQHAKAVIQSAEH